MCSCKLLEDRRVELVVLSCEWPLAVLHSIVQRLPAIPNVGLISTGVPLSLSVFEASSTGIQFSRLQATLWFSRFANTVTHFTVYPVHAV